MAFLSKIFSRKNPNEGMRPLYHAIVDEGRRPDWYEMGDVPDTLDGRFDMIATILSMVMIRLESDENAKQETAWLTELFVTDMDGQLREIGVGHMVVGKHVKRMMGALGGRLGAYREAFQGNTDIADALTRNLYRGAQPNGPALNYVSTELVRFHDELEKLSIKKIIDGQLPRSAA